MDDEYRREYEPWAALDSSLDAVLRRHPRAREMLRLGAVQAVWAQAVGATVARAAQPVRLQVRAWSAAWRVCPWDAWSGG